MHGCFIFVLCKNSKYFSLSHSVEYLRSYSRKEDACLVLFISNLLPSEGQMEKKQGILTLRYAFK